MVTASRIKNMLADDIVVATLVPWPCPSPFGLDQRYRLEEVVAATRHSLLYRATDLRLSSEGFDATVAIKVGRQPTDSVVSEASILRRINHPNVLNVIDRGVVDGELAFVVTEFIEGETLAEWQRPASLRAIVEMMEMIARGIQAAHTAGVCHLDLKPGNILISRGGQPKVADFGLASIETPAASGMIYGSSSTAGRGNLAFMAPEQYLGLDTATAPPADIYALGGLLYWLLSSRYPNGESEEEIAKVHAGHVARADPCENRTLASICRRALSPEPALRHHSAGEFADDLSAWAGNRPIAWLRPSPRRVGCLWVRRNALLSTLLFVVTLAGSGGVATAWWVRERDRRLQLESESNSRRLAEEQLDRLKKDFRKSVQGFASAMFARSPANIPASLVWLNWLTQVNIIDEAGTHAPPEEITRVLQRLVADEIAAGRGSAVETLFAKHALAFVLIEQNNEAEARLQLEDIRASWTGRVPPDDPIWSQIELLERCTVAMNRTHLSSDTDQAESIAFLRRYLDSAEQEGPIERLVRLVLSSAAR